MTGDTDGGPAPADDARPGQGRDRRMMLVAAGMIAAVVATAAIAAYAGTRDDGGSSRSATEQIAVARRACRQWLADDAGSVGRGPAAGWCDDLAGWMSRHMSGGQMRMGHGMWTDPAALRDVCVRAMGGSRAVDGDVARWCDRMVDWMSRNDGVGDG